MCTMRDEHKLLNELFHNIVLLYIRDSANACPHYQKLCARATPIWGSRRSQPTRSAMHRPRPGGTAFMITVSPAPGKYEIFCWPPPDIYSSQLNFHKLTSLAYSFLNNSIFLFLDCIALKMHKMHIVPHSSIRDRLQALIFYMQFNSCIFCTTQRL